MTTIRDFVRAADMTAIQHAAVQNQAEAAFEALAAKVPQVQSGLEMRALANEAFLVSTFYRANFFPRLVPLIQKRMAVLDQQTSDALIAAEERYRG